MRADYTALSLLRCRSTSCNGIIYWPLNKGGPFFNFGCVDYAGRPMMSYYALKRLFADVVVNVYRDVNDIRVVAANSGPDIGEARLVITRVDARGKALEQSTVAVTVPHGNSVRLHDIDRAYGRVADRWTEAVHARLEVGDRVLSEDTLFFCSWYEFKSVAPRPDCRAARKGEREWSLEIASDGFSKMVGVESAARIMLSDNYFTQLPGQRAVLLTALDAVPAEGLAVRVESLDTSAAQELVLRENGTGTMARAEAGRKGWWRSLSRGRRSVLATFALSYLAVFAVPLAIGSSVYRIARGVILEEVVRTRSSMIRHAAAIIDTDLAAMTRTAMLIGSNPSSPSSHQPPSRSTRTRPGRCSVSSAPWAPCSRPTTSTSATRGRY